ncbi:MAG: EamA family transporter [Deltaproteobacteria bacterium HGW-Deltaproteobacteria-24]|jgi:drug/metabolite transporter (DMT)-like permease|nr:MAG: EamA family transporter [Deltaproteobacteria bacterium HGW-Deltaproteobacteria-24]
MQANNHSDSLLTLNLILALLFLASNSVLCKLAFVNEGIDAFSFTAIRLFSGALVLFILVFLTTQSKIKQKGSLLLGFLLFVYAICFSYSYLLIDTGIGALILFGMVQITMIGYAMVKKMITPIKLVGALIAFLGLAVLLFPSKEFTVSLEGFFLMAIAGIAWGIYSILGKNIQNPLQTTSNNFFYSMFFIVLLSFFLNEKLHVSHSGFWFAFLSGGITSGIGYVLWYSVVQKIQTTTASIIQLSVPVVSTMGGILFLQEELTFQLILATIIILSGIAISSMKGFKR